MVLGLCHLENSSPLWVLLLVEICLHCKDDSLEVVAVKAHNALLLTNSANSCGFTDKDEFRDVKRSKWLNGGNDEWKTYPMENCS